jgi:hypothetical protein
MKFYLTFFILTILFLRYSCKIKLSRIKSDIQWTPHKIIDKLENFQYLIDPENFFNITNSTSVINNTINFLINSSKISNFIKPLFPIVIILPEISEHYTYNSSRGVLRKNTKDFLFQFSNYLLKKFSIEEDNSILLLFLLNDKQVNIRIGENLKFYFSKGNQKKEILQSIKNDLKEGKYANAIIKVLEQIRYCLEEHEKFDMSIFIILAFVPLILLIIISPCFVNKNYNPKKENELEKSSKNYKFKPLTIKNTLEKFEEINRLEKSSEELFNEICLFCLKYYEINNESLEKKDEQIDILVTEDIEIETIITLQCGHFYHYDCEFYYKNKINKECVDCRFKNEKEFKLKENYQKALIHVHSLINKDFEFFNLNISDGKIIWHVPEIEDENHKIELNNSQIINNDKNRKPVKFTIRET